MARLRVPTAAQQIEAPGEALEDLPWRQHRCPSGCELDGKGQVVEPLAERSDRLVRFEVGPRAEELDCLLLGQRRHRVLDFALDAQQLSARDQQAKVGAGPKQRGEQRRPVNDLLEVVQQEQQLALADMRSELLLGAQRLCHRLKDEGGISKSGETDPENAVSVFGDELPRRLEREPCLARAARPDSVTNLAPFRSSETTSATSRPLPTKELAGRGRLVFEIVFSGGKRTCPSW